MSLNDDNFLRTGRRDFIKRASLATLGLAIGIDSFSKIHNITPHNGTVDNFEINPFILIGLDNTITIVNPRNDMGQGTLHSVPAMIAEELEVSLAQIKIIQSDGQSKYGAQTSGNSSSIRRLWLPLRKAGAATKEMLIKAAARQWGVLESECYAREARVFRKGSDTSLTYGELAGAASKLEVPADPVLKHPADFSIIGKDIKRAEIPARTNGKAVYGIDIEVPGMVYASILHSPMIFGKIVTIEDSDTLKIPGVLRVIKCERKMIHRDAESVAVIATDWWAALKGRNALKVQWDNSNLTETLDTEDYFKKLCKGEGGRHQPP